MFWIYQKYWELQAVPLTHFGYIWAGFALAVSLSARFSAALDSLGMQATLLVLLAVFAPLMGLVLVPLVVRIRRERAVSADEVVAAS